ncbi:MAG: GNAT family N-acetyltransferase [Clostridia bacterium]|nr:GNAT family N-acetyltransferase [Clostridia bacterium]
MEIKEYIDFDREAIEELYRSVGWINYLKRSETLEKAYENSLCTLAAYEGDKLIGIIRAVGDGLTIVFIQDIIVLPEYQRMGVGSKLLNAMIEKYRDVYQIELFADNVGSLKAFYRSAGFTPSDEMGCIAYIRMN